MNTLFLFLMLMLLPMLAIAQPEIKGNDQPADPTSTVAGSNELVTLQPADAYGQNNLGWMYESGVGVTQNDAEAVKWFRKAADQGNPYGQANLGWMYETGRGVSKNTEEAIHWYQKAAGQGLVFAHKALLRLKQ